jgi:hypothetical protein
MLSVYVCEVRRKDGCAVIVVACWDSRLEVEPEDSLGTKRNAVIASTLHSIQQERARAAVVAVSWCCRMLFVMLSPGF